MIWLWLYLTIPSLGEVHKYLGWNGAAVYLTGVAVALRVAPRLLKFIPSSRVSWLAAATVVGVAALFIALYPIAQSLTWGPGGDSDDSVNGAVTELLHGRYPYYSRTYLGNSSHDLPGMMLLSVPFVLLGNSAYMNLFWLPVFLFVLERQLADSRRALLVFCIILVLCPAVMHGVVTGNDQLGNSIAVAVSLWVLVNATTARSRGMAAVLLGLALSWRPNFLLVIPTAAGYMARKFGWSRAVSDLGGALATFLAVTMPFYLHDPEHFTPLEGADRLTRFNGILPHLGEAIGVAALLLAIWLGWRSARLFASCAMVQGFIVVAGLVLSRDIAFSGYGVFALFIAMLDCGPAIPLLQ